MQIYLQTPTVIIEEEEKGRQVLGFSPKMA
jgi:hypothetical protein